MHNTILLCVRGTIVLLGVVETVLVNQDFSSLYNLDNDNDNDSAIEYHIIRPK